MNAKPNLRLCDENDAMQVEPSFEYVLTQIDSLKTEFADIEANLYEQLAIDGQLKTLDALSLQKSVCPPHAVVITGIPRRIASATVKLKPSP